MTLIELANFAPVFLLIVFRVAGVMLMSPFFSSMRVPNVYRVFFAVVVALGMAGIDWQKITMPGDLLSLTFALTGEFLFGMAMGMMIALVFIAAQWAGEMVGQQVGFSLGTVFDPQFGGAGSPIGDLYFYLTLVIFLLIGGHRLMLQGVHESLVILPPMSLVMNADLLSLLLSVFNAATVLALRVAAPVFVTLLIADVAMGFLSKTIPQFNILSAGLGFRTVVGLIVLVFGIASTGTVIETSLTETLELWIRTTTDAAVGKASG
jgi:flagellar biosynthesis protein FliR